MKAAAEKSVAVFGLQMRKKWLWILVLPVLLCGAVFWARGATLKRQEAAFRSAMRQWMWTKGSDLKVSATDPLSHREVDGRWNWTEFRAMLDDLHLQRAQPDHNQFDATLTIRFPDPFHENVPGENDMSGFYLDLEKRRGLIDLPNQNSSEHWENFEFTPETCRMIKKRIFALQEKDGKLFTPQ